MGPGAWSKIALLKNKLIGGDMSRLTARQQQDRARLRSIKMGYDISASILLTGCIVSMALLEVAKAIRGE